MAFSLSGCGNDSSLKTGPLLTGDWTISTNEGGKPVTGECKIQQLDEGHFRGEGKDVSPYYIVGLYNPPSKISFNKYYVQGDNKHSEPVTWTGDLVPGDSLKASGSWQGTTEKGTWQGEQTRPAPELEVSAPADDMKYPDQSSAASKKAP